MDTNVNKKFYIKHFETNPASEFVYVRTYAKWREDLERRETWEESVDRYVNFLKEERGDLIPNQIMTLIKSYILDMKTMPSMRALWAAGDAARYDNLTTYNCSYCSVDSLEVFGETLYLLMCGVGVGFSVEEVNINKLPIIAEQTGLHDGIYVIDDSKLGWKKSLDVLFNSYYRGREVDFDYSKLRSRGARLKTLGGRSSGPDPLRKLHDKIKDILLSAQGRKLSDIECHDIMCRIAEIVVVGGVRRSSEISFSDLNSDSMRYAKSHPIPPHRFMSNNSAVYRSKPSELEFLDEWVSLAKSGSGERGIFHLNKEMLGKFVPRREWKEALYANPCGESLLRNMSLCNLTEVIVREEDTFDDLLDKIKVAVWVGVIQSTFTHFPHFRDSWRLNAEEERLLGVSLTGQMDNQGILTAEKLEVAKRYAIKVARKASKALNVNMPAQITLVKPSGTVSQLVNSSSGIHTRFSPFYIRRYRISSDDPLVDLLRHHEIPLFPEVGQTEENVTTYVIEFPVKSPKGAITRKDLTAIEQLENYKKVQSNWCEGNVSQTIYVKENEWIKVGAWVYENFDEIIGISFLPYDGGHYELPPYSEITEDEYDKRIKSFPKIDYSLLSYFEMKSISKNNGNGNMSPTEKKEFLRQSSVDNFGPVECYIGSDGKKSCNV